jgi:hypothetical protein
MYSALLLLHSWLRWAVILFALAAIVRAVGAARSRRAWLPADDRVSRLFIIALDLQILIGLVLYFGFSPITRAALADFGGAMKVSGMRFWAVEHGFGMIIAVALAHAGRARAKRSPTDALKHRRLAVFYFLALIAVLASIPWPGTPYGRPLLRW